MVAGAGRTQRCDRLPPADRVLVLQSGSSTSRSNRSTRRVSTATFSSSERISGAPWQWATVKFQVGTRVAPAAYQLGEM